MEWSGGPGWLSAGARSHPAAPFCKARGSGLAALSLGFPICKGGVMPGTTRCAIRAGTQQALGPSSRSGLPAPTLLGLRQRPSHLGPQPQALSRGVIAHGARARGTPRHGRDPERDGARAPARPSIRAKSPRTPRLRAAPRVAVGWRDARKPPGRACSAREPEAEAQAQAVHPGPAALSDVPREQHPACRCSEAQVPGAARVTLSQSEKTQRKLKRARGPRSPSEAR